MVKIITAKIQPLANKSNLRLIKNVNKNKFSKLPRAVTLPNIPIDFINSKSPNNSKLVNSKRYNSIPRMVTIIPAKKPKKTFSTLSFIL